MPSNILKKYFHERAVKAANARWAKTTAKERAAYGKKMADAKKKQAVDK